MVEVKEREMGKKDNKKDKNKKNINNRNLLKLISREKCTR